MLEYISAIFAFLCVASEVYRPLDRRFPLENAFNLGPFFFASIGVYPGLPSFYVKINLFILRHHCSPQCRSLGTRRRSVPSFMSFGQKFIACFVQSICVMNAARHGQPLKMQIFSGN